MVVSSLHSWKLVGFSPTSIFASGASRSPCTTGSCGSTTTDKFTRMLVSHKFEGNKVDDKSQISFADTIMQAGVGTGAAVVSIFFTMMLALVAIRKGRLKALLILYMTKNVVLIICEAVVFYLQWIQPMIKTSIKFHRFQVATSLTVFFGLVFPLYANFIVYIYLAELNKREEVARRLYVAWHKRMEVADKARKLIEEKRKKEEDEIRKKQMLGLTGKEKQKKPEADKKDKGKDKAKKKKK